MNRKALFRRTASLLHPDVAMGQTFLIIGVGSGGARLAEEAARFGVGRILLVDRPGERLEEHNIIRHPLGYSCLGKLKVEALRQRLLDIHPDCAVETYELDVNRDGEAISRLIARSTQVHLATDNEASKHAVNERVVAAGVPLIFAGVFDGGCGGEVGRVLPGGACYACIAAYLVRRGPETPGPETFDYSNPDQDEFRSTAALNIDISQIALIQARVAILTLLGDPAREMPGNYILFGNRRVEGLFPRMLSSEMWEIQRSPSCMVCGHAGVDDAELARLAEDVLGQAQCTEPIAR